MKALRVAVVVLGLVLVAMIGYYFLSVRANRPSLEEAPEKSAAIPPSSEPEIAYPLPEAQTTPTGEKPLPELAASDPFMKDLLTGLYSDPALFKLLIPYQFIQRLVLIIDALPRKELPLQHLPLRSPAGSFEAVEDQGRIVIGAENAARYIPYVKLAEAVPVSRLADTYVKIYPLFQDAYRELGHPQGYFNDRMIVVLDHLLATPEVDEPIALTEHVKRYRYADPALEDLSAGRKILLRMGRENARRVRHVLQAFRDRLVALATQDESPPEPPR